MIKQRRTSSDAWIERTNPLLGLSIAAANQIYDSARQGNYSRIQYLYNAIEASDPVLMTCIERRSSALAGMGWRVVATSDSSEANEQADFLKMAFERITNLDESIEHLASAFFRGFAHCSYDAESHHVNILNSWNFARDQDFRWYWNPNASYALPGYSNELTPIPEGELISVVRPRAIDYPALSIYLRHALAEKNWGRFLERYGIPPCILTMPDMTNPEDVDKFRTAAAEVAEANSGALPYGTNVNFATEARGTDPFSNFISHQEKLVVLLSTGGTLTSLAESGTGTLAGNAQMDVWEQIVRRDSVIVANAIDRTIARQLLAQQFIGRPILARFEIGSEPILTANEVFEIAAKAKAAGYIIRQEELEARTGFKLEKDIVASGSAQMNPFTIQNSSLPHQAKNPLVSAMQEDCKTIAEDVCTFIDTPSQETAIALSDRLEIPHESESLEKTIAETLAQEYSDAVATISERYNLNLSLNAQHRGGNPDNRGQFSKTDGSGGKKESKTKGKKLTKSELKSEGVKNMPLVNAGLDVKNFMPSFTVQGTTFEAIDFLQGNKRSGYIHIKEHKADYQGQMNHQAMLDNNKIPQAITYGKWYEDGNGFVAVYGKSRVKLGINGKRLFVLTAFESENKFLPKGKNVYNMECTV